MKWQSPAAQRLVRRRLNSCRAGARQGEGPEGRPEGAAGPAAHAAAGAGRSRARACGQAGRRGAGALAAAARPAGDAGAPQRAQRQRSAVGVCMLSLGVRERAAPTPRSTGGACLRFARKQRSWSSRPALCGRQSRRPHRLALRCVAAATAGRRRLRLEQPVRQQPVSAHVTARTSCVAVRPPPCANHARRCMARHGKLAIVRGAAQRPLRAPAAAAASPATPAGRGEGHAAGSPGPGNGGGARLVSTPEQLQRYRARPRARAVLDARSCALCSARTMRRPRAPRASSPLTRTVDSGSLC